MKDDKKRTLVQASDALFQKLSPQYSPHYSSTLHLQQVIWVVSLLVPSMMLVLNGPLKKKGTFLHIWEKQENCIQTAESSIRKATPDITDTVWN